MHIRPVKILLNATNPVVGGGTASAQAAGAAPAVPAETRLHHV